MKKTPTQHCNFKQADRGTPGVGQVSVKTGPGLYKRSKDLFYIWLISWDTLLILIYTIYTYIISGA